MNPLNWLFRRGAIDRDLDVEIRSHFRMAITEHIEAGEDPESARLAAINEFGNVLRTKEAARPVWQGGVDRDGVDVWQDVRFGTRMLIKKPGFSLVVIAVFSLGIAGNAAIFSLFKGLASSPYRACTSRPRSPSWSSRTSSRRPGISIPDYRYIKEHDTRSPTSPARYDFASVGLGGDAARVSRELVTGNYFEVLGVGAQLGPHPPASDDVAQGRHPVAVIGDGLWRRTYGGDPNVIGKTLYLNGQPLSIVGVADPEFRGTIVSMVSTYLPRS